MYNTDYYFIKNYIVPYVARCMSTDTSKIVVDFVSYYLGVMSRVDQPLLNGDYGSVLGYKQTQIIIPDNQGLRIFAEQDTMYMVLDLRVPMADIGAGEVILDGVKYRLSDVKHRFFNDLFFVSHVWGYGLLAALRFKRID